jgi:hypothetical protein
LALFQVGLSMAGAISAGAYTAGVVDFLCEALSEWEKVRGQADIPQHRTAITVMSGASAGGIITALLPVALADGIKPVTRPAGAMPPGGTALNPNLYTLPALYRAWVERPTLFEDPKGGLLGLRDLADSKAPVCSALDTTILDEVCAEALQPRSGGQAAPHPWIGSKLHLFLTVSNLHGVPYGVAFSGTDARGEAISDLHVIQLHGDRVHFALSNVGAAVMSSVWADQDPATTLDIGELFHGGALPPAWVEFGQAALATSAFPIGLKARLLSRPSADIANLQWPIERPALTRILPAFPKTPVGPTYGFANVDGGMINNEPFEFAHWTLLQDPTQSVHNESTGAKADRAILMIDPFPEAPAFDFDEKQDNSLVWVLKKLVPTLTQQARFKLEELVAAADEDRFSRFMIQPERGNATASVSGERAIACGLLGGFGGFLDRQLRAHDYQLGRRNCQWFLRHSFCLPPENPLVAGGDWTAAAKARFQTRDGKGTTYHPIIPLLGTANLEVPAPAWPSLEPGIVDTLMQHARERADAVVGRLIDTQLSSWVLRQVANAAWSMGLRSWALGMIKDKAVADLKARGHIPP